jgi:hypothetical protein
MYDDAKRQRLIGNSGYFMGTGLLLMVPGLTIGVPGHGPAFVAVMCVGWGLIAYGAASMLIRFIRG